MYLFIYLFNKDLLVAILNKWNDSIMQNLPNCNLHPTFYWQTNNTLGISQQGSLRGQPSVLINRLSYNKSHSLIPGIMLWSIISMSSDNLNYICRWGGSSILQKFLVKVIGCSLSDILDMCCSQCPSCTLSNSDQHNLTVKLDLSLTCTAQTSRVESLNAS